MFPRPPYTCTDVYTRGSSFTLKTQLLKTKDVSFSGQTPVPGGTRVRTLYYTQSRSEEVEGVDTLPDSTEDRSLSDYYYFYDRINGLLLWLRIPLSESTHEKSDLPVSDYHVRSHRWHLSWGNLVGQGKKGGRVCRPTSLVPLRQLFDTSL